MKMHLLESLYAELKNAIRCHYNELITRCGVDTIYGYSILTDDDVDSIGPVANKERLIKVDKSDPLYNYYRYGAVEWSEWDDFGMFDEVNKIIKKYHETVKDDFNMRVNTLLRELLNVLMELESEGLFGDKNDNRFIVICVTDSSNDIMIESARLLNTLKIYEAYASEFA
ncbi:DUF4303 domain-containing protein [Bacillus toyonensis]|nr:hypothetical protein AT259_02000 [Bacillus cereus]MDF9888704.1 hypothetical protein [Bacillus sp. LEw-kw-24]MDH6559016.1 hypothetical protein [Bacillus sp. LEw-kw-2]MDH8705389.1 hypothetical protein [Stenotrophomonas sp. 1198]MDP9749036.1 hypothetical protein [Bacillus thuringiensis]PEL70593.1 DUF4303 domain-containing protein [Bacillus toyonensis]